VTKTKRFEALALRNHFLIFSSLMEKLGAALQPVFRLTSTFCDKLDRLSLQTLQTLFSLLNYGQENGVTFTGVGFGLKIFPRGRQNTLAYLSLTKAESF
jgi:hypothetical protein